MQCKGPQNNKRLLVDSMRTLRLAHASSKVIISAEKLDKHITTHSYSQGDEQIQYLYGTMGKEHTGLPNKMLPMLVQTLYPIFARL